ncbi:MAG: ATP-binding cassette domain-containing protein [Gemmatimonadales bacterium]
MSDGMEVAVRCEGLRKRYGDVVAVDGLDLEVLAGECFGLLGPNGAGKTTTVEILEGLLKPDAGDLEILGMRWGQDDRALRQRIGVQLQQTQLAEKLTVEETLALFRSFFNQGRSPDEVMRIVGLQEKRNAWVSRLSGGQQQRLALACALVSRPDLLFLDEPTTGLDPQSRRQLWDLVLDFKAAGGTVLLTTHYMEEAHRLCDRVAVVDRGRIIALGTPSALIAALGAEHVVEIALENDDRAADDWLLELAGVQDVRRDRDGIFLTVSEVHKTIPALLAAAKARGAEVSRLTTHHATLEDVFMSLTGRHLRDE